MSHNGGGFSGGHHGGFSGGHHHGGVSGHHHHGHHQDVNAGLTGVPYTTGRGGRGARDMPAVAITLAILVVVVLALVIANAG